MMAVEQDFSCFTGLALKQTTLEPATIVRPYGICN